MWHVQQAKDSLGLINVICHIRSVRIVYISDFCPTHAACLIRQKLFLLSFPPFLTGPLEFHLWCDELWVKAASCANIELLQPAPFSPGSTRLTTHTRLINLKAAIANCHRCCFFGGYFLSAKFMFSQSFSQLWKAASLRKWIFFLASHLLVAFVRPQRLSAL